MAKLSRKGLGRGLSALLGDDRPIIENVKAKETVNDAAVSGRHSLPTAFIERNAGQPRIHFDEASLDDLATSIKEKGVLQPILVRGLSADKYQIVAGERRWRAAQRAGIHEVPVVVLDLSDKEVLEIAIVENIQRQDLSAIEEAHGFKRLMEEFGHTQEAVGQVVGKSRSHITNLLRLLTLPEKVQNMIGSGILSMGHARALIGSSDPVSIANTILKEGLSVRQVETLTGETKGKKRRQPRPGGTQKSAKDADTVALEKDLSAAIGMKVSIDHEGEAGCVVIRYKDVEQLDDLCSKLGVCGV
jgi:ParB family transcriptional regulator, chromosome partitioning protein